MSDSTSLAGLTSSAYQQALEVIAAVEPRIAEATKQELIDQRASLKLIASEELRLASRAAHDGHLAQRQVRRGHRRAPVLRRLPERRHGGDARRGARPELFGAPYAYAQPHSGIDANLVAFWSILAHRIEGPWLEKAEKKNVNELTDDDWESCATSSATSGCSAWRSMPAVTSPMASVRTSAARCSTSSSTAPDPETGLLDYDVVRAKAKEFNPLVLVAGYSAYPRRVNFAKMREIADEVGATLMVDMAHFAGLVAGKVFTGEEDPVPFAHITTTTTHKSLRGPRGGMVLAQEEYASSVDRGCPMVLGGPLSHVMAAKAVALAEARRPEFQTYAQAIADNAKSLADGFLKRDAKLVTGGTDNHIVLLDVQASG